MEAEPSGEAAEPASPPGWGVPDLEEIATLVLASPEVVPLEQRSSVDPEQPLVIASNPGRLLSTGSETRGTRTVLISPATEEADELILHLMIFEATPYSVAVGVDSGSNGPLALSWTRTPDYPEWSPGSQQAF